ncbi:MAG TPA: hypothetical protein VJ765_12165 [Chitinophagaceae bacterium]|nr:hypothetical protein [Chitinophagaceae bacterium]
MHRAIYMILFLFACTFLQAQESVEFTQPSETRISITEKTIYYPLAENIVPIKIQQYGNRTDIVFINLHDDETTSVEAAKRILQEQGGTLIEIENNALRNIRFRAGKYFYEVDPNRIFSKEGIKKSLEQFGKSSGKAVIEVEKFGQRIIQLLPEQAECIIALHNNTPDFFSAVDFTPQNRRSGDSKKVYINPGQDADDFFLTTDHHLYQKLTDKGFNSILQDNKHCSDDGSLSVYCGKKNIRYVNCETEHGKTEQYFEMITALMLALQPGNK